MLPVRVSNPGSLTYESGALLIALRGLAISTLASYDCQWAILIQDPFHKIKSFPSGTIEHLKYVRSADMPNSYALWELNVPYQRVRRTVTFPAQW